jgi:hypothetical protein
MSMNVGTDESGREILYEGTKPIFCLTKNHLIDFRTEKFHIVSVRAAKVSEIQKMRRVAHPEAFLDLNRTAS